MTLNLMVNNMPVEAYCSDRDVKEIFIPLLKRLQRIAEEKQGRALMMLAAPPAAGKSTLLKVLKIISEEMPDMPPVEIIGIDGYHRYNDYLKTHTMVRDGAEIPMVKVKGCPESFDLKKLTKNVQNVSSGAICKWPDFDRMKEDPVEDAFTVASDIVILEGNYLLLESEGWKDLRKYADYTVSIRATPEFLRQRLIRRRVNAGVPCEQAVAFVDYSDMVNVRLCLEQTGAADLELFLNSDGRYSVLP